MLYLIALEAISRSELVNNGASVGVNGNGSSMHSSGINGGTTHIN